MEVVEENLALQKRWPLHRNSTSNLLFNQPSIASAMLLPILGPMLLQRVADSSVDMHSNLPESNHRETLNRDDSSTSNHNYDRLGQDFNRQYPDGLVPVNNPTVKSVEKNNLKKAMKIEINALDSTTSKLIKIGQADTMKRGSLRQSLQSISKSFAKEGTGANKNFEMSLAPSTVTNKEHKELMDYSRFIHHQMRFTGIRRSVWVWMFLIPLIFLFLACITMAIYESFIAIRFSKVRYDVKLIDAAATTTWTSTLIP